MNNKRILGNSLLIFASIIWGMAFAFQRMGMESIEPATFASARMVLAAVAVGLVAFALDFKKNAPQKKMSLIEKKQYNKNTALGGLCCGLFLTGGNLFQQMGLVSTSAGKAGFITAMYMLFVPIVNFLFFKKKNTFRVWFAVVLGVVGMYLLCVTEAFKLTRGDALVLLSAVCFTGHILCCDHFVQKGNPIKISAIQFAVTAMLCGAVAFITETPTVEKLTSAAVPILYCGLISAGVGYTLQIVAQKFTDPTVASLLMSLESVFAVVGGMLILGENMKLQEWIGCIIIFGAIILVQLPSKKASS